VLADQAIDRQSRAAVDLVPQLESSIGGKWLDLLKEVERNLVRVAVMLNPDTSPQSKFYMQAIEAAALSLGVKVSALPVRATAEIEPAVAGFAAEPNGGLILPGNAFTGQHQSLIAGPSRTPRRAVVDDLENARHDTVRALSPIGAVAHGARVGQSIGSSLSVVDKLLTLLAARKGEFPQNVNR